MKHTLRWHIDNLRNAVKHRYYFSKFYMWTRTWLNVLDASDPPMSSLKPSALNVFRAPGKGPLLHKSDSGLVFMVKGRLYKNWVFVYYYHIKLKDGVTYMVKRG